MKRLTTHDELKQPWVIPANDRTWRDIYKKLSDYEDAEEDGRLIILPVAPYQECFMIDEDESEIKVGFFGSQDEILDVMASGGRIYSTYEDAEATLAEMKEQNA